MGSANCRSYRITRGESDRLLYLKEHSEPIRALRLGHRLHSIRLPHCFLLMSKTQKERSCLVSFRTSCIGLSKTNKQICFLSSFPVSLGGTWWHLVSSHAYLACQINTKLSCHVTVLTKQLVPSNRIPRPCLINSDPTYSIPNRLSYLLYIDATLMQNSHPVVEEKRTTF